MDNATRYFMPDVPIQDAPFREQLLEHLVLFDDILGGQGARSIMSVPIPVSYTHLTLPTTIAV